MCIFATKLSLMPKVSVILPIYNVAPYLDETFQSLIQQSLRDIEIIAVNDGSTDNSEDFIKKYQKLDSRIISFSQENKGQSAARNVALQYARGKYIYMMDSDDILNNFEALQICYDYAEKNQADFIFFDGDSLKDKNANRFSWNTKRTQLVDENKKYEKQGNVSSEQPYISSTARSTDSELRSVTLYLTGCSFFGSIVLCL